MRSAAAAPRSRPPRARCGRPPRPRCAPARSAPRPSAARSRTSWTCRPPTTSAGDRKYPVVYALHGLFEGVGLLGAARASRRSSPRLRERGRGAGVPGGGRRRRQLVLRERAGRPLRGPRHAGPRRPRRGHLPRRARAARAAALLGISMGGYAALHIAFDAARRSWPRSPPTARCCSSAIPSAEAGRRPLAHGRLLQGLRRPDRRGAAGPRTTRSPGRAKARPEDGARALLRLRRRGPLRPRERPPRAAPDPRGARASPTPSSCPRATTATSSSAPGSRRACASSATP